ncbi:hypothetical protein [uncultured Litoreibacter sp.]|uniref:hypothetical protein n=1 Tax=uncultured Litoreibacter sp. TaxID=1392394 RepID=UPI002624C4E7|nr:hypothetical protein [uncultured Litoreibacter sp.]
MIAEPDKVRIEILKLIVENEPIGWYAMERKLRVPRGDFREGYTLMSYLKELEEEGFVTRNDEDKYISNKIP